MDVEGLFNDLESNNSHKSEEAKKTLTEFINQTKEQCVLLGVMDYYMKTNSARIIDVLVKVQSPNDVCVLDRIAEWMRGPTRVPALNLFGFIVRKHPTWLFKVSKHKLIKEILKLLQVEKDIIPLMSALLCVITLLPIIPSLVPSFLNELFEVFGHLASWNLQISNNFSESRLIHLQIGLYMLFHRLYGMFPNSFINYLRTFLSKDNGAIFQHTIKPLLETVRMHPMLVTGSSDSEKNNLRWKEKEPHDVVIECAKLSLDYHQDNPECFPSVALRQQESLYGDSPAHSLLSDAYRHAVELGVTSPLFSEKERNTEFQNTFWSPTIEALRTPPQTGGVPHTPTPSYGVPNPTTPANVLGATGASPPDAAEEATPDTTPSKDMGIKRSVPPTSSAVRSILGTSQPSSPMKKEVSPFEYPDPSQFPATATTSQRFIRMINDRTQSNNQIQMRTFSIEHSSNQFSSFDSPTTPTENTYEDQEVNEFRSHPISHRIDTLEDISYETEQSPCSEGGLHVPTSKSIRSEKQRITRNRLTSYCINDCSNYLSYGTSPAGAGATESFASGVEGLTLRRANSCPAFDRRKSLDECNTDLARITNQLQDIAQQNGDSSSPSGEEAISAATHFQKKSAPKSISKAVLLKRLEDSRHRTCETQTIQQLSEVYEYFLLELFAEDNKLRSSVDCKTPRPYEILDQYIERTISSTNDSTNREVMLRDQIQLLQLQLHYERYRREIHAERNRRLLGKSRTVRSLEMDNVRLKDQLKELQDQVEKLNIQLKESRENFNRNEHKLLNELNECKSNFQKKLEENNQLRAANDNLQRRLSEENTSKKEINLEIDALRGSLFDTRNDLQQAQYQAELGMQYKQELTRLQTDFMVMGEIQLKCRDKLADLENSKARDEEINQIQEVYNEETRELRSLLDTKSGQLEALRNQVSDLQISLSHKENAFTEQKRALKSVKEEYEEKFKALEKKYETQKVIMLHLEDRVTELSKSPESEKNDISCSVDYNSPLSISVTSNDSLSASFRSVSTELRNLQALVSDDKNPSHEITNPMPNRLQMPQSTIHPSTVGQLPTTSQQRSTHTIRTSTSVLTTTSNTSSITEIRSAASPDIPVPGTSQHRQHYNSHH